MTPAEINAAIADILKIEWYAVEKGGWYYRQGGCGYTARIEDAGRYTKEAAERLLVRGEPMSVRRIPPPDFHGSLDACALFEAPILKSGNGVLYIHELLCKTLWTGKYPEGTQFSETQIREALTFARPPARCAAFLDTNRIFPWILR